MWSNIVVNLDDQDEKDPSKRMLREKLTCCPLNKNEAASHKLPSIIAWDQLILKRSMMMLTEVVMIFMLGSISLCTLKHADLVHKCVGSLHDYIIAITIFSMALIMMIRLMMMKNMTSVVLFPTSHGQLTL